MRPDRAPHVLKRALLIAPFPIPATRDSDDDFDFIYFDFRFPRSAMRAVDSYLKYK
jgi:hypothetical protein